MAKENSSIGYNIGKVTEQLGISADTLRYYEKIGLLPPIHRAESGKRVYDERDLSRLRFIRRAKLMNFSLDEIGQLLKMRENPQYARDDVRELAHQKLKVVEEQRNELNKLFKELTLLINLCQGAEAGCPIIEDLDSRIKRK